MKNKIALTIMALGLALPATTLNAQDDSRPPRGPRGEGPGRPGSPLIAALDLNRDGKLETSELNAAPESLRSLDKNTDGVLADAELHPGRGPRGAGDGDRPNRRQTQGDDQRPARQAGPPFLVALDTNGDGSLDASEINNATAALKTLDKNGDGEVTRDEIGGPRGPRGPRGGGPGADRPPGRGPRPGSQE
jgi:hypothetical protein